MSPFKSQAQRRFMHSQHPEVAERWEKEYPVDRKLPEKKGRQSAKSTRMKSGRQRSR